MTTTSDDLAKELAAKRAVEEAKLDEAIQRQVLDGGALDTVLMELGIMTENQLLPHLEKVTGLPALDGNSLNALLPDAVSLFPKRLADKHGIVPISLDGRRLTVATCQRPDLALIDEIGFMLSLYVRPYVTTEARFALAKSRLYGETLSDRFASLLSIGIVPSTATAPTTEPSAADVQEAVVSPTEQTSTATSGAERAVTRGEIAVREPALRTRSDDVAHPELRRPVDHPANGWTVTTAKEAGLAGFGDAPDRLTAARADGELLDGGVTISPEEEARDVVRRRLLDAADAEESAKRTADERRRQERVRWTVDDAIAELAMAPDRDALVDIVLRFGHRRLDTAAMFVVAHTHTEPSFSGWDIIDPVFDRALFTTASIPADGRGALAQVFAMRSPFLGPLDAADPLVHLLGRSPRAAILVPVVVGGKLAAVLYGDCGAKAIPPSSMAELHMIAPRFGEALRNLILQRKRKSAGENPGAIKTESTILPQAKAPEAATADELLADDFQAALDEAVVRVEEKRLTSPPVPAAAASSAVSSITVAESPRPPIVSIPRTEAPLDAETSTGHATESVAPPLPSKRADRTTSTTTVAINEAPVPSSTSVARAELARPTTSVPHDAITVVPARRSTTKALEAVASPTPVAEDGPQPPSSPGAHARESDLIDIWKKWVAFEDDDTDALLGELQLQGERGRNAILAIVGRRDRAMTSLARYFPGVLRTHPFARLDQRPEVADFSDALACMIRLGADRCAPILVAELNSEDRLHRYSAVHALYEIYVPAALPRLAARVFDPEYRIALLAGEVLPRYKKEKAFEPVLMDFREHCKRGSEFQRRRALSAICSLRDQDSVPLLIDLLSVQPKEVADDAKRALVEITLQDFGTSIRKWKSWAAENKSYPRLHWLIDGLEHNNQTIRQLAQQDLTDLTGNYFNYRADGPAKERDIAVSQWRAWYRTEGKNHL